MTEPAASSSSPAIRRLRRHLAQPGAFARLSRSQDGALDLFISGKGPTLGHGSVPSACASVLVEGGEAEWRDDVLKSVSQPVQEPVRMRDLVSVPGPDRESPPVIVNRAESPLAWLAARHGRDGKPLLAPHCAAAGERLRADLERAAMLPRMGIDWTRPPGERGGGPLRFLPGDTALAARQRCDAAFAAVGSDLTGLLIDVCGFLKGLSTIELERGWPPRSARIMLEFALTRLAGHYGLSDRASGPERNVGRRHVWREPDQPAAFSGGEGGAGVGPDALDHGADAV